MSRMQGSNANVNFPQHKGEKLAFGVCAIAPKLGSAAPELIQNWSIMVLEADKLYSELVSTGQLSYGAGFSLAPSQKSCCKAEVQATGMQAVASADTSELLAETGVLKVLKIFQTPIRSASATRALKKAQE